MGAPKILFWFLKLHGELLGQREHDTVSEACEPSDDSKLQVIWVSDEYQNWICSNISVCCCVNLGKRMTAWIKRGNGNDFCTTQ